MIEHCMIYHLYIMTRKVNQDVGENLFSFLKGIWKTAFNNITPLQFKYA